MQDAKELKLPESEIGVEQIIVPETVFYVMWNDSQRGAVYINCFLCDFCIDPLNAMHTAHDEHHFPPFFIICELPAPRFARQN